MPTKKILVPTDFSDAAVQALDHAVELARSMKAELVLLFVVEPVYYAAPADLYGASASLGAVLDEQRRAGREQLARLTARLQRRKLKVRAILATGIPHDVIVEMARKVRASMIVMATHGRTGLSHLLLGSVTERVVRTAECPVLTLRVAKSGGARKSRRIARR
jgi:nucleotide-binding universal stress UspA family protein